MSNFRSRGRMAVFSWICAGVFAVESGAAAEKVLHNFSAPIHGNGTENSLALDAAGNLYGTSYNGGNLNLGVVFKLLPTGVERVLHSFAGGADGSNPSSGVALDSAGNVYGVTYSGGTNDLGVVYKLSPTGDETILHNFAGGTDGANPNGAIALDGAGNLYGVTSEGGISMGTYDAGVVYELSSSGSETLLHTFTAGPDGANPVGGVIRDPKGNLYGATVGGGSANAGVVFKVSSLGAETVVCTFAGGAAGQFANSPLTEDAAGNLYGTMSNGGSGAGVVFLVSPAGKETVLYSFTGGSDGGYPQTGVIRDRAGNLYGACGGGGPGEYGVVFKLSAEGQETVLYGFSAAASVQGQDSEGGVIFGGEGTLYGATVAGGPGGTGVIYSVTGVGQESVLYSFPGSPGGFSPQGTLIKDSAGNLYGTNSDGGIGFGAVYRIHPDGQERVLYSFTGGADGALPLAGVTADAAGNLYGTTVLGGSAGEGVVYKLDPAGQETALYTFTGKADGGGPSSGVIVDANGNVYGTASGGGALNFGVVYEVSADGLETILHTFEGGTDGAFPQAAVTRDPAGNLYGTTVSGGTGNAGVVYRLSPTGQETILYSFTGGADGGGPASGVVFGGEGILYGTTNFGGANGSGVVFQLSGTTETVLFNFNFTDGAFPGTLVRGPAGNLFGTAAQGGSNGDGVIFEITASGSEVLLHDFTGADGSDPTGLLLDSSGTLYGATFAGGQGGAGVVYEFTP